MGTWEVETQSEVGSRSALSLSNTGTGQITRPPWLRRISSSLGARPWWEDSAQFADLPEPSMAGTEPCPVSQVRPCITDQTPSFLTTDPSARQQGIVSSLRSGQLGTSGTAQPCSWLTHKMWTALVLVWISSLSLSESKAPSQDLRK